MRTTHFLLHCPVMGIVAFKKPAALNTLAKDIHKDPLNSIGVMLLLTDGAAVMHLLPD